MKSSFWTLAFIVLSVDVVMIGCAGSAAPASGLMSLEEAIAGAADAVEARTQNGDAVAVVKVNSPLTALSEFLVNELDSRFNAGGKLAVLARGRALESIEPEKQLQLSGLVSDETAAGLGRYMGAKAVVSGDFTRFANFSQFAIRAVDVETAQALAVYTAKIRNDDPVLAGITAPLGNAKALAMSEAALEHLNIGKDYLAAGVYNAAIEEFNKALARNRKFTEAWFYRGEAYWTRDKAYGVAGYNDRVKGDNDQALADYTQALALDPNYAEAYKQRGRLYYSFLNDYDKAIADYTRYIRLKPDDDSGYIGRGYVYSDKKDYRRAIADYTQAIKIDPNADTAYFERACAYAKQWENEKAIADYIQAFTLYPGFYPSRLYYYTTSSDAERDLAIEAYTRYIKLNPANVYAWYYRGRMYGDIGDYDKAIADYTQAIRIDPNSEWTYYTYYYRGLAYFNKMDYDKAIADYTQAIRIDPNYELAYSERGLVYYIKNDYDKAIADYTQAIRINPNSDMAYYYRGLAYFYKVNYEKAIVDFTQAIRIDPNSEQVYRDRGWTYYYKEDYDKAIADYTQAIRIDPNSNMAYYTRGLAYFNKMDYDRAIADFEAAVRIDPNMSRLSLADAYNNRGAAYFNEKKDYNRAIADFEAAVRNNPNHPNAKENLAIARRTRGY